MATTSIRLDGQRRGTGGSLRKLKDVRVLGPAVAAVAALLPLVQGSSYDLGRLQLMFVFIMAAISLNLAFGFAGQLAIAQPVMLATGAYTAGILSVHWGWTFPGTLVPATIATVVMSLLLGLPSLRIRGWYFAVTSFFAVVVLPDVLAIFDTYTGGDLGLVGVSGVTWGGERAANWMVYELFLLALVVSWAGVARISRSSLGVALRMLRDHPIAAEAAGLNLMWTRARVYLVLALPCAFAGVLYAHSTRYLTSTVFSFTMLLVIVGGVFIGGKGTLWGPVIGCALFQLVSLWLGPFSPYNELFLGIAVLVSAIAFKGGVVFTWRRIAARVPMLARYGFGTERIRVPSSDIDTGDLEAATVSAQPLRVEGVSRAFGGNVAVRDVGFEASPGRVFAVIGPNGSGKTTLLNVISGLVDADEGDVFVGDQLIGHDAAHDRARKGIARTFQVPRLVDELTFRENVEFGSIALEGNGMTKALIRRPNARPADLARSKKALAACRRLGCDDTTADEEAEALPLGTKRLVEVARAMVSDAPIVCLDEPAAGLSEHERDQLGEVLRALVAEGRTVLLVEHNLRFVLEVADDILLLQDGEIAGRGTTDGPRRFDDALRGYLGTFLLDYESQIGTSRPASGADDPADDAAVAPTPGGAD